MRRIVVVALVLVVALTAAYAGVSAIAWSDVTTVDGRCLAAQPDQTPANFVATWSRGSGPEVDAAPYRFDAEDVAFESLTPGLGLRAWWAPPTDATGRAVILVHGKLSCRRDAVVLLPAGMLHRAGFGVLVVDLRDHGESDRDDGHWAGGVDEWQDVLGAWQWLRANGFAASAIGMWGGSMGAGSVVYAMAHEPQVAAAFLDSPYAEILPASTAYGVAHDQPAWIVPGALFMGGLISGDNLLGDSPSRLFRERLNGRPVFIVHGTADSTIDVNQGIELAEAATAGGSPTTPWLVKGAEHVQSAFVVTAEYEQRLRAFFEGALDGS